MAFFSFRCSGFRADYPGACAWRTHVIIEFFFGHHAFRSGRESSPLVALNRPPVGYGAIPAEFVHVRQRWAVAENR